MTLEQQVQDGRQEIHTDAYPMSIGEIISIYKDGDLDIHPEFQREFRWKLHQKSELIESILLGIPLPSIFVAQRDDGVWDVVDGVQRLSTIMSFVGELLDESGGKLEPLILEKTKYLPKLEGICWEAEDKKNEISTELKRAFKREKIDIKIIKKESDRNAKFELFQRLNTGGSSLSEQEVRNCLLLMLDKELYEWLKELSRYENFLACLNLTERQLEEKYEMELALRFIISANFKPDTTIDESDIGPYITSAMKTQLVDQDFDRGATGKLFEKTFDVLHDSLQDSSFKRYSKGKSKHEGAFSVALFEFISTGVALYLEKGKTQKEASNKATEISKIVAEDVGYKQATKHGVRAVVRFPKLVELARTLFQ